MSLTVKLKNIGILKQAEFSLGDLTLICGENNTGKTYAAYALYGFLKSGHNIHFPISDAQIQHLLTGDVLKIGLTNGADSMLAEACQKYPERLDEIFAAPEGSFQKSEFHLLIDRVDIREKEFNNLLGSPQYSIFTVSKRKGSEELMFTLVPKLQGKENSSLLPKAAIAPIIAHAIFSVFFPNPFIFSAERAGVAIFRKEFNFARDRLLEEIKRVGHNVNPRDLLLKASQSYPRPVQDNADFTRRLEDIAKHKSFIAKEHPEILEDFANIVGGAYVITSNDQLYYIPKGTRSKLTMVESSSAARALLDLSFYLNCIAEKGDLLMVDEPELSLHPENQRRIARLFARLANLGVKVFVTTHSDYIVKELNTLIMLNHDKPHIKRVAEENGYQQSELINADQVKVYVAEKALMPLEEGQKRRRRGHTLVPAKIHPELGIGVSSFDKTIDDMNRIQDDIVWGEE